jgi:FAD/FMN-containing dehydrogenase
VIRPSSIYDHAVGSDSDLRELAGALRGDLLLPGDDGYDAARLVWNSRYDDVRPAAVAEVAGAADVVTVVEFARDSGAHLIPRGGGHSFAGFSTGDGVIVDVGALTEIAVDPAGEHVRLGAGSKVLETYRALWPHRKAICGGTCPTVGIAGLTLGGGLGVLSRRYGVTADSVVEIELVTADGRLRRVNDREEPDLFWALRGAGGGNFGIVTAFTFRLVPVDTTFTHAQYRFPWDAAEDVITAWQDWLPTSPRETWTAIELVTQSPADGELPLAELEVVHAGPHGELETVVADLLGAIGAESTRTPADEGLFVDVERDFYCKGLRPKEIALAQHTKEGKFPRPVLCSKSDVARGPWPREGLATLVEWIEKRQRDRVMTPQDFERTYMLGCVLIEPADAAVNEVASDATAFAHRDNLFLAQYGARWLHTAPPEVAAANVEWLDGLWAATEPHRSGASYVNYADLELDDFATAYHGANLERLREVKHRYDAGGLFSFAQSI